MHQTEYSVSETWLDSFGHVNNARYLEIYEQARWDWLHVAGMSAAGIHASGIGPVVLQANLRFIRELLPRQVIVISSHCSAIDKKIITLTQQMHFKDSQELASELVLTAGIMDLKARKLILPPDEWLAAFS